MTTISLLLMEHPRNDEVFVDTSALYAVLDADDEAHVRASAGWRGLLEEWQAPCHLKLCMRGDQCSRAGQARDGRGTHSFRRRACRWSPW